MRARLVVFAKEPVAGRVKTRLVPALGEAGAAALAREMLAWTLAEARASGLDFELCGDPHPRLWAEPPDAPVSEQGDGGLGERLARAAERALAGADAVLLIGADCPELGRDRLAAAAAALERCDAFLNPAEDGGYVLLGLRRFDPSLFEGIGWGGADVFAGTLRRLGRLGWTVGVGERLRDVDSPDDLLWLAERGEARPRP